MTTLHAHETRFVVKGVPLSLGRLANVETFKFTRKIGGTDPALVAFDGASFAKVIGAWTNLKVLMMETTYFESHDWVHTAGRAPELEVLAFGAGGLSDDELLWLVKSSRHSLRELCYIGCPVNFPSHLLARGADGRPIRPGSLTSAGLLRVFDHTPNLKILSLENDALTVATLPQMLVKLPKLKTLTGPLPIIAKAGLKAASSTLEYVLLQPMIDEEYQLALRSVDLLRRCDLAQVKTVTLIGPYLNRSLWGPFERALAAVLRARGIAFEKHDNPDDPFA